MQWRQCSHHGVVGGRGGAGPGDAEGERDGQEPAHRAQRAQRPALHLADPHRARDRRQGLRVHHMAMSSACLLGIVSLTLPPGHPLLVCFLALHVSSLPPR